MENKKPTFEEHEKLIWHVIKTRFGGGRNEYEIGYTRNDLFQLGAIGLLKAIEKFNPDEFNAAFSTYAIPTIWGTIIKELRDNGYEMKAPRRAREIHNKIKNREILPSISEIIKEFGNCTEEDARVALEMTNVSFISLDKPLDVNGNGEKAIYASNFVSDNINIEDEVTFKIELEKRLSALNEKERAIFDLTAKEIPQREIGQILGISQVQVSRILRKAVEKAKNYYEVVAV